MGKIVGATFQANFFFESVKDIHAGGNKTRASALNKGVELVLVERPLRIYWQTPNERCGRECYTEGGSCRGKSPFRCNSFIVTYWFFFSQRHVQYVNSSIFFPSVQFRHNYFHAKKEETQGIDLFQLLLFLPS